ncbi:MAG: hypothetical protein HYZ37_10200, partial [Candidatus Solibacter usitatus]|nr:hypothetical protein [Candidatus Solibacter usitatus]
MKATVNITIVSRTFRRRGAPAVKEADVITVAPVRESLPPAPRKGLLSRIIRLLSPLLLLPLLPAQDTPYTFQLESVDLTRGLGDGTLTAEAVQTGNSFVVSVSLSANGNTSSGTVRWDLTRASFNGRTATIGTAPFLIASGLGPQFTGNLTHNGGNRSLALGVTVNTVIATATVGECDKQAFLGTASMVCAITSFPLQTRTGRRFARVAFEILIAVAGSARTVAVGASYAFEPAPNSIQFIPTGSSVTPDPSKGLATGTVTFGGRVRYTRQAASFLALRLFDLPTGGILQGSSDFIAAAQTSGEQNLEIKDFAVKDDVEQLYLKAVIID